MIRPIIAALFLSTALVAPAAAQHSAPAEVAPDKEPHETTADEYAAQGRAQLEARLAMPVNQGKAKNLIIFIGDGMGISTLTAGRIWQGQKAGRDGESNETTVDSLPYSAVVSPRPPSLTGSFKNGATSLSTWCSRRVTASRVRSPADAL